ncbi:WD40 repeat domain-containing protein [Aerosakkonemataceae cyanobacterium BLCC-F50]|uniref:WD40 repeat domain-containing protein n=1 Tax=Floridaenema flaviceps BLCC-F50 TaxID=3153642 RepID=A0ABV4XKU5_9CYAN
MFLFRLFPAPWFSKKFNFSSQNQLLESVCEKCGISALAFSHDGKIASASEDGMIKVWSLQPGQVGRVLHNFTEHQGQISAIAFSPDGQTLVSSSMDKTIKIWDLKTNKLRYSLPVSASDVAISPDGTTLASTNLRNITLWNLSDGKQINNLPGHTGLVSSLVFNLDGKLVSGSRDSTIRIWQRK